MMMNRMLSRFCLLVLSVSSTCAAARPNILIAISDDQSYPHASAYGCEFVSTPAFDRVAREGVLFHNAFAASPGCSPCRAALLTGRHPWQLEEAGTHASYFPRKYRTFPEVLEEHGYFVGYTGKGWGPGDYRHYGRERNPAGPAYSGQTNHPPYDGMSRNDYAANFKAFLDKRPGERPFCFWYGAFEPHRRFEPGQGSKAGKSPQQVDVPTFLPDRPEVRSDLMDYAVEIEWFDSHLGKMLDHLDAVGELDQTLIIVTSDNGMAFPRAKANCYESGIHMPLAIRWGERVTGGRVSNDLIGFVDLTATIYEAAGITPPREFPLAGRGIMNILESDRQGVVDPERTAVFSARERHSSSRYQNLGYPQRAMRTQEYLYIWNCRPKRWPAGAPRRLTDGGELGPQHGAYHDIDGSPTLTLLTQNADDAELGKFLQLAVARRPEVEIYDIRSDPGCLHNLAGSEDFSHTESELREQFEAMLNRSGDPRIGGDGDIFESYPRVSRMRTFPKPRNNGQR